MSNLYWTDSAMVLASFKYVAYESMEILENLLYNPQNGRVSSHSKIGHGSSDTDVKNGLFRVGVHQDTALGSTTVLWVTSN